MSKHKQMTSDIEEDVVAAPESAQDDEEEDTASDTEEEETTGDILALASEATLRELECEMDSACDDMEGGLEEPPNNNYDRDFDRVMLRFDDLEDTAAVVPEGHTPDELQLCWQYEQPGILHEQDEPPRTSPTSWYMQLLQMVLRLVVENVVAGHADDDHSGSRSKQQAESSTPQQLLLQGDVVDTLQVTWAKGASLLPWSSRGRRPLPLTKHSSEHHMSALWLTVLVYMSMQSTCSAHTGVS